MHRPSLNIGVPNLQHPPLAQVQDQLHLTFDDHVEVVAADVVHRRDGVGLQADHRQPSAVGNLERLLGI